MDVLQRREFNGFEQTGVAILGSGAIVSILAILGFAILLTFSGALPINGLTGIPRTHVGLYILCYLMADLIKHSAAVINLRWAAIGHVEAGDPCSFQGVVKQVGNVGTAVWCTIIAIHLFNLLFWRWEVRKYSCYATIVGGWAVTMTISFIGPSALKTKEKGDFYGVTGYWCWIREPYASSRVSLEYVWMFLGAGLAMILYVLLLLRLRGNLTLVKGRLHFRWHFAGDSWQLQFAQDTVDRQLLPTIQRLSWFPVIYILTVLPMAITRFCELESRTKVPFAATFVANIPFSLSGLFTAILFYFVRKTIPLQDELPTFAVPRTEKTKSTIVHGITPFSMPGNNISTSTINYPKADQMGGIDAVPVILKPEPAMMTARRKPVPYRPRSNSLSNMLDTYEQRRQEERETIKAPRSLPNPASQLQSQSSRPFEYSHHERSSSASTLERGESPTRDSGGYKRKWQGGSLELVHSNHHPNDFDPKVLKARLAARKD